MTATMPKVGETWERRTGAKRPVRIDGVHVGVARDGSNKVAYTVVDEAGSSQNWPRDAFLNAHKKKLEPRKRGPRVITLRFEVTEAQRKGLAKAHGCKGKRATADEMHSWAGRTVEAWLRDMESEGTK